MVGTKYRPLADMTPEDVLRVLIQGGHTSPDNAITQAAIFRQLGGDPTDHRYAYLSFRTKALRDRGHKIGSSRRRGIWLIETATTERIAA